MKTLIVALLATAGITFAGVASAQADVAQKYCGTCHAVDTKKMGPSFKDIAAKYKGNASAEADLVASDAGIDGGAASAEEAAVHVVEDDDTDIRSGD